MNPERWRKIEELYHAAQELAPAERNGFLAGACRGDEELQREVEDLLAQEPDGHILDDPASKLLAVSMPAKLGPYEIGTLIGAGGMGEVYKAHDPRLRRSVALKVLPAEVSRDVTRRQRFEREARAVAALNHPNIVAIYDVGEDRGIFFIVTELVDGEPLRAAGLSLRKALDIAVQIASGLDAAHQAGVVHRDLKPGNILVDRDGHVKILDFGLAKVAPGRSDQTATLQSHPGVIMGTPGYMSPEQVKGEPTDHRSDIFSFGLILYELLAGQRAFQGSAPEAMAAILNSNPPELPETVPSGVRQIVAHCLDKDPARRFQSARDLSFALSALSQTSVPSVRSPIPARSFRWPLVAWIAIGAAALIATILLADHSLWSTPAPPLQATVLTSFVGFQGEPSLSPDGSQFAFTWDGDVPNGPKHVYISLVGKGAPLRLTPENEDASGPSWSPDGQSIAFLRGRMGSREAELLVMPALGGTSRRVATGLIRRGPAVTDIYPSWSPDAKWLLWSQFKSLTSSQHFIHAAPAAGGEKHQLLDATSGTGMRGHSQAISPDGRELVWIRCEFSDCDLYLAGIQDGESTGTIRQLTHDHKGKRSPLWTNDGKEIVYLAGDATSEISMYRVRVSGGEPRRIVGIGADAVHLNLAAKRNRMLYSIASVNYDIRRFDLNAAEPKPERFLSSTRYEGSPSYSPDGKRIAFSSNRVGVRQIWVADSDGANPSPLTSFSDGIADNPKWSPDGQFIVFSARPEGNDDIYTVPSGGGPVRRLTDHRGVYNSPAWSSDGNWIYFSSTRAGVGEIFRMRRDDSTIQQVTHNGGGYGVVSPDGKCLYYAVLNNGVWKMPADGGKTTQVLTREKLFFSSFVLTDRGIYAVGALQPEGYPVVFYPFNGGRPRTLTTLSRASLTRPDVSPDGRWFLYATPDEPVYQIMLVDDFR
jgi:serine/threonine protein kinase/WD40 repeat protein